MAIHHKLVAFDRPLANATIPGRSSRYYTESEVAAIRIQAYQEGSDSARQFADQQLVEFRAEVQELQQGLFSKLLESEGEVVRQLQGSLPALVIDIARRLLANYEPPAEVVESLCRETLEQLYPERENLEVLVSPRDAALLEQLNPAWRTLYPGLKITSDGALKPGDCQVRSRFGITDARLAGKLANLSREIFSAQ